MAGKGTRWAKDFSGPKQLMPVAGKPILEHGLDQLPPAITELIFVVGGPHEAAIREYFKANQYAGKPITFVIQKEQLGLAHAFKTAKDILQGRWLGMVGDDIYGPEGMKRLVEPELALLSTHVPNPEKFGVLITDKESNLVRAVEKPQEFVADQVWTGAMVMDEEYLNIDLPPSARGEYETPDVWTELVKRGRKIKVVDADFWLPINDKEQFHEAERILSSSYGVIDEA